MKTIKIIDIQKICNGCKFNLPSLCDKGMQDIVSCEEGKEDTSIIEQVPETFSDLQELCETINSKQFAVDCGYTTRIIITEIEFRRKITFHDNGLVIVSPDKDYEIILTENRTPQQMWQIIKNLIGEE